MSCRGSLPLNTGPSISYCSKISLSLSCSLVLSLLLFLQVLQVYVQLFQEPSKSGDCCSGEKLPWRKWHFVFCQKSSERPQLQPPGILVATHFPGLQSQHALRLAFRADADGHEDSWGL